jgi:hypothetical protein
MIAAASILRAVAATDRAYLLLFRRAARSCLGNARVTVVDGAATVII